MRIKLFGDLVITTRSGSELKLAARKSALALAFLALSGPKGIRRDRLCGLLWADRNQPQARASLRQALVELRRQILLDEAPNLQIGGDSDLLTLSASSDDVDVWRFDELLKSKDLSALEEAADLYGGELLAGVELPEAAVDWIRPLGQDYTRKALRGRKFKHAS